MVTLYHWDLPSAVYERVKCTQTVVYADKPAENIETAGWTCPGIVDEFAHYSRYIEHCNFKLCYFFRTVYGLFGDRVKYWITLNEPTVFSDAGYDHCEMAPGECGGAGLGRFARHYSLLAHGKAYEIYNNGLYRFCHNFRL